MTAMKGTRMRKGSRLAFVLSLALLPLVTVQGGALADHEAEVITITPDTSPQTWQGDTATGANVRYFSDFHCKENPPADQEYCDTRLLHVDVPANFWDEQTGGVEIVLDDYFPPGMDFDMQIFASDEHGTKGRLVGSSGNNPGAPEQITIKEASGYYLIWVVYFAVTHGTYEGHVELFRRDRAPADVDAPAGLQEFLASDPSQGWTSRSEPHIAQSPVDPDVLVAGSKFYNKDPDALNEYEFKIGSYASFDGGRSWSDLGQLGVCPAGQAPPSSWPNNTCYPADDPNADGTGQEDIMGGPSATVNEVPAGSQVSAGEQITGSEFSDTRSLADGSVGPAPVFFADDRFGCEWTTAVESGIDQWIGLAQRGGDVCPLFNQKLTAATAAGADGLIVINNVDGHEELSAVAEIPGLLVDKTDGGRLRDSLVPDSPQAVKVTMELPRGPDFAEEYITSDIWMQFDHLGNAYAMVLDAPPFQSGDGWGMTLHKWESVSPEDLQPGGKTWSDRIPINKYEEAFPRDTLGFLDDKNTFAINNAGRDEDDPTGPMIACWGQNIGELIKQQIVCERSTDGAESWPDSPVPISGAHQLVIGVHVVADAQEPETFYATWLQYASGIPSGAPTTLEFNMTTDGGQTWLPQSVPIATISDIPRQFPRQGFRNLSIPIMAVGPESELYIAIAEYLAAPDPDNDEDGMQADIIVRKCLSDCAIPTSWSGPINITDDTGPKTNPNADQFQPYITVTKAGQVNVAYFDRRLDLPRVEDGLLAHPGNFFTDVFLARSNDGGATFSEMRLTHDATDPEFNAPVSSSGLFFGDYQGLVADDCVAIPFFNDTHLANDEFLDPGPDRDPEFDQGMPSSPYQEAVAWRVPNIEEFGGETSPNCLPDLTVASEDIRFSKGKGRTIRISATIHNVGGVDALAVPVVFSDEGTQIGEIQTIELVPAGGSAVTRVQWDTPKNRHEITVTVDPANLIQELDETNNAASRVFGRRR